MIFVSYLTTKNNHNTLLHVDTLAEAFEVTNNYYKNVITISMYYSKYFQTYITSMNPIIEVKNYGRSTSSKRPRSGQVD